MSVEYAELEARTIFSIVRIVLMEDGHRCMERAMHHNCPVCFEFLFDSTRTIRVLPCRHTIHLECLKEMELHHRYSCPVCSKSICEMSKLWEKLDEVIASTPMPEIYERKMVWILCNVAGPNVRSSSTLWHTNALTASPTTLDKHEELQLPHAPQMWLRW